MVIKVYRLKFTIYCTHVPDEGCSCVLTHIYLQTEQCFQTVLDCGTLFPLMCSDGPSPTPAFSDAY